MAIQKSNDTLDMLISATVQFCEKKIAPIADKIDRDDIIPEALYSEMRDQGMLSLILPQRYGGLGLTYSSYIHVLEIVSKYSAGVALSLEAHNSLGLEHIAKYGSEELKENIIPEIIASAKPVAWALTEPRGGSDAKRMSTTALAKQDGYILNGSKTFITHGFSADKIVVMAKTNDSISAFVIDADSEGVERTKLQGKMGTRGSDTAEIHFNDVFIPKDRLLGREGEGFEQAMELLHGGRIAVGAMAVGMAEACIDASIMYSKQREAFGSKISRFEAIRFYLADLSTELEAAKLLVEKAASLRDNGLPHRKEAAMAKYYASQVAMKAARTAIQIHGGYGFFSGSIVERMYRDAKLLEIGEGTNEVLKLIISSEILRD
ncbi:MAG: acyl-CoA dehydrogenase family protein [Nitrososphaerota archaeon]